MIWAPRIGITAVHAHGGAVFGECERGRFADARSGAGDQGGLTAKLGGGGGCWLWS